MERELSPEEEKELTILGRKMLHTALPMTKEEEERHKELIEKKYGTAEEIAEEIKGNRKRFYKFQESLGKKLK